MQQPNTQLRLCIVGSMIGRHPGMRPSQGEFLASGFAGAGYPVMTVSSRLNRYARLWDIAITLLKRRKEIDVLLLQVYSGLSFVIADLASALGMALGRAMIFHLHGGNLPEFARQHPGWARRVLRRADRLVAPSAFLARELGWLVQPIRVIPNPINLEQYPYQSRGVVSPKLFWMRAFHPIYNPELAVRVVGRLLASYPEVHLVMAGSDEGAQAATQALVERLGLEHHVTFSGFLDQECKIQTASQQDIFLSTNRIDNMPVSVIEMSALGLPVVATNVGGLADTITDGVNGLLTPDDDDRAMAEAVCRLLVDPILASKLSQSGRQFVENFAWEKVLSQWELLISEVVAGRRRS